MGATPKDIFKDTFTYTFAFIPGGFDGKRAVKYQTCRRRATASERVEALTGPARRRVKCYSGLPWIGIAREDT
jgi:hypothetical protein